MSPKQTAILKSYLRGVVVAITPLLSIRSTDSWAYLAAVVAGVIAPALRALDKNDPAFGIVADLAVSETASLDKKATKK